LCELYGVHENECPKKLTSSCLQIKLHLKAYPTRLNGGSFEQLSCPMSCSNEWE